ncbi:2Fe-2S iron-sulfur cluster binding domain-containing protein [Saccharopolyspora sp. HNM0983]|uniref:2Fe-2S iron-sulfur cluster binding domain-containing protein n=1 Tax=Saccharopolyspora montiporae TaxID=2781240 RepID=A0A929BD22_9PSEU|nr:2Fe-2S iron-sulfur cluster binding domain-containing protein [Saccharopolyspora sp. HNM0983]MBE9375378.1 2Fe-2S iron-sulfur cluster binding domain-containing protein [Saccharopolyspora sp. HNM0983]
MGEAHRIRFEPVDIEIEATEDETVLDAAFRQGIMPLHGCKEGQCSSCKSFLLDGDLQMDRYSTFALADYESEEGYVLLCRAHAYSDLDIELINYDEDMLRAGLPVVTVTARVEAIEALTHDISLLRVLVSGPDQLRFHPGQYVDIGIPGSPEHRSFSMANLPNDRDSGLDFIIKRYPGGKFSGLLEGELSAGDPLEITGPYGTFTLRASSERRLVFIGGGAGMAPILSVLRQIAAKGGFDREVVFYYGARTEADLFLLDEMRALDRHIPNFRFVPCLSDTADADWDALGVDGWSGTVTSVADESEAALAESDVYMCGPPPMIDAGLQVLEARSVPQEQIFYDKFTVSAEAG